MQHFTHHTYEENDDTGERYRVSTEYRAPESGGYVEKHVPRHGWFQVCDLLWDRGPTLRCGAGQLADVVRRERRAQLRRERRELAALRGY